MFDRWAENCTKDTGFERKLRPEWPKKQVLAVKSEELTGFERKLRPEWEKKQDLAVKSEGACWDLPPACPFEGKLRPDRPKK